METGCSHSWSHVWGRVQSWVGHAGGRVQSKINPRFGGSDGFSVDSSGDIKSKMADKHGLQCRAQGGDEGPVSPPRAALGNGQHR